ncbi:hypothetical protein DHX103_11195 [Planococcus sp. X10-3]|uniref:hypothetical protein n=1 Tax=Planococcus sp. X10-3 TaxID=3061240 RepID=UPI003BAE7F2C
MKHLLSTGVLALMLLLGGCGNDESEVQSPPDSDANVTEEEPEEVEGTEEPEDPAEEEPSDDSIDPLSFFMADGTIAHFEGVGNEFATLTIRTEYLEEGYVALYEDNGGTTMLRVYRLSEDRVDLVKEEGEFYEDYNTTFEELEELAVISTYLEFPLEEGNTMGDRTVVQSGAIVETPYETFEDAIVLESKGSEDTTNIWYFVEGYGEVKREFVMQEEGEEEFRVTSSLESIE